MMPARGPRYGVGLFLLSIAACGSSERGASAHGDSTDAGSSSAATPDGAQPSQHSDAGSDPSDDASTAGPLSLAWVRTFTGPGHQSAAAVFAAGDDVWATTEISEPTTFGSGEAGEVTIDAETVSVVHASLDAAGSLQSAVRSSKRTGGSINGGTLSGPVASLKGGARLVGAGVVGTREFASGQPKATVVTAPQATPGSGTLSPQWSTLGRYDASGALAWMHTITGSGYVGLAGVSAFDDGAFVMAGSYTGSVSLGPSTTFSAASAADVPAFVARADATGSVTWASGIKGTVSMYSLDIDASGASYVAGDVRGVSIFGPGEANETTITPAATPTVGAGFVARYAPNGKLAWAQSAGDEVVISAVVRTAGGLVVSGSFAGSRTVFGTPRKAAGASGADRDGFVAKLDEATGGLVWFEQLTGTGDEIVDVLRVDPSGQVWAIGWSSSSSLALDQNGSATGADADWTFAITLDDAGAARRFERIATHASVGSIAFAPSGAVTIGGQAFPGATVGGKAVNVAGVADGFVARFSAASPR